MDKEQYQKRVTELLFQECAHPARWHYLSFAENGFRGAAIIFAPGLTAALIQCNMLGINPGGEVVSVVLPDDEIPEEKYRYRLLSLADLTNVFGEMVAMGVPENMECEVCCECCNKEQPNERSN